MSQKIGFAEALDAAEQLDADAQAELVAVLSRRLAERGRERVAAVVAWERMIKSIEDEATPRNSFPPGQRFPQDQGTAADTEEAVNAGLPNHCIRDDPVILVNQADEGVLKTGAGPDSSGTQSVPS